MIVISIFQNHEVNQPGAFGHPVAVYPDPELTSLATARGWPVIGGNHKVNVK
jgi:hypothetical protein